jgi:hypothetical protein
MQPDSFANIMKPESELGGFDKSLLDQFDDTLAAIHHLSKGMCYHTHQCRSIIDFETGQMKVIIAPHDAHALRGSNDVPCDAYCQKLDGAFLDFYSSDECAWKSSCVERARTDHQRSPRSVQNTSRSLLQALPIKELRRTFVERAIRNHPRQLPSQPDLYSYSN